MPVTTLHTRYMFRPENASPNERYVKLYFETGSRDVIIDSNIEGICTADEEKTLQEILETFLTMINGKATAPVFDTSGSLRLKNDVLEKGQFGIESDTFKIKVGDGIRSWINLPYINGGNSSDIDNREAIEVKIGSYIQFTGSSGSTETVTANTLPEGALASADTAQSSVDMYVIVTDKVSD